jgi:hypothetical protein
VGFVVSPCDAVFRRISVHAGADPCDCVCALDADWTLGGLTDGLWTVASDGVSTEVRVIVE